jgi:adenosylcobinamide-phosphate synthase
VARAAIESLAESFCDGVAGAAVLAGDGGPAGVWAYKALNTADSLIGHPEPDCAPFGWAAARADDAPTGACAPGGVVLCLAGGRGWRVMARDCRRHASPNAGWPEAAMAGALGRKLAGPISYDGVMRTSPGSAMARRRGGFAPRLGGLSAWRADLVCWWGSWLR